MTFLYVSVLTLFVLLGSSRTVQPEIRKIPFSSGEILTFQVRWAFISAGQGVLEIHPITSVNGTPAHHFSFTAKTSKFADVFYKVRDRIDSYTDIDMTRSLHFTKQQDGKRHRRIAVYFDWEENTARYTDLNESHEPISVLPNSFDVLSVFYAFRLYELREGLVIELPVTDGKKNVSAKAAVIRRESIEVGGKEYHTFLVEPSIEGVGGLFDQKRGSRLRLWVTADGTSTPVKIESELVVGKFVAELIPSETYSTSVPFMDFVSQEE